MSGIKFKKYYRTCVEHGSAGPYKAEEEETANPSPFLLQSEFTYHRNVLFLFL
jgi:hypothetical protein